MPIQTLHSTFCIQLNSKTYNGQDALVLLHILLFPSTTIDEIVSQLGLLKDDVKSFLRKTSHNQHALSQGSKIRDNFAKAMRSGCVVYYANNPQQISLEEAGDIIEPCLIRTRRKTVKKDRSVPVDHRGQSLYSAFRLRLEKLEYKNKPALILLHILLYPDSTLAEIASQLRLSESHVQKFLKKISYYQDCLSEKKQIRISFAREMRRDCMVYYNDNSGPITLEEASAIIAPCLSKKSKKTAQERSPLPANHSGPVLYSAFDITLDKIQYENKKALILLHLLLYPGSTTYKIASQLGLFEGEVRHFLKQVDYKGFLLSKNQKVRENFADDMKEQCIIAYGDKRKSITLQEAGDIIAPYVQINSAQVEAQNAFFEKVNIYFITPNAQEKNNILH